MYNETMEIIPSVLVSTAENFLQQAGKLIPFFQRFQIDIADGKFVPEKTVTLEQIRDSLSQSGFSANVTLDFDLMINETTSAITIIDELAKNYKSGFNFIHNLQAFVPHINVGIAIDPAISVETIIQGFDLDALPAIQIMSVVPGAQGQAFIPETLNKIEHLRKAGYRHKIFLDGGINPSTLPMITEKQFRPDAVCVGSYLSRADDLGARIKTLRQI